MGTELLLCDFAGQSIGFVTGGLQGQAARRTSWRGTRAYPWAAWGPHGSIIDESWIHRLQKRRHRSQSSPTTARETATLTILTITRCIFTPYHEFQRRHGAAKTRRVSAIEAARAAEFDGDQLRRFQIFGLVVFDDPWELEGLRYTERSAF